MKILITGASGKLAHEFIEARSAADDLVLLSRNAISEWGDEPNIHTFATDLSRINEIEELLERESPQAIIHLASVLGGQCDKESAEAFRVNVELTEVLATLAVNHNVERFIFTSTAAVYNQVELCPTDEQTNVDPQSEYGKTKLEAEQRLHRLSASQDRTQFVSLRGFNVYGSRFEHSLVQRLIGSTPEQPVPVYGPDNYYRDYVHASDYVEAIRRSLTVEMPSKYETINVGSGVATSNRDLIDQLEAQGVQPHYRTQTTSDSFSQADTTKAQELLGLTLDSEIRLD